MEENDESADAYQQWVALPTTQQIASDVRAVTEQLTRDLYNEAGKSSDPMVRGIAWALGESTRQLNWLTGKR